MLIIQVNDPQLEQQIEQQARATGRAVQQLVQEVLAETFGRSETARIAYTRLDPANHRTTLLFDIDPLTDDAPAFQHVSNSTEFADQLRQNAWKR